MPGTAIVTINENEWSVEVATTTIELSTGLAGRASLPAGTGMLFVLPVRQVVTVDTTQMLFPIDIIFIKDSAVLSIANNISPGYLVEEATPCDMFLEVNADEADLVEVGDIITITTIQEPGIDWSSIMAFAMPLIILAFFAGLISGTPKLKSGSSSGNPKVKAVAAGKEPRGFYWKLEDPQSGEIMEKDYPYDTWGKARAAARSFALGRVKDVGEHDVHMTIYNKPHEDPEKEITYEGYVKIPDGHVVSKGFHREEP